MLGTADPDVSAGPEDPFLSSNANRSVPWTAIAVGVVLTVAIRLRSFWSPVTSDEGGFLAIARAWANGKVLYRDVWVDRPQGLLAIFRFWDFVSGGSVASLRIMAMIFGGALVITVGVATTLLAGRSAGAVAAILVGIAAASPAIEGHLANGELLSGPFAVGGVAVACLALRRTDRQWLMVVSGMLGGCALSVKQSGYEGLLAIGLWLVVAAIARWRTIREVALALVRLIGGVLIVIAILALHGALTGYSRWWFAFAGYRLGARSAIEGADWDRFFMTARIARPTIWPLLAICAVGVIALAVSWVARRGEGSPSTDAPSDIGRGAALLVFVWALSAAIAFLTGGQFHRHYWITLCPSLCALAAVLITRRMQVQYAFGIAAVLLIPTYVNTFKILHVSDREFSVAASGDDRPNSSLDLANWFLRTKGPGDQLYVMCASASFYADADEDPPLPYLWQDNVQMVPGAIEKLRALLSSPTRAPRFVALYEPTQVCDPSGQTRTILATDYEKFAVVSGVQVLQRITS